ncbi:MAG TPA: hypothetical protein VML50_13610, partial [Anaeromyxobacter sp.]|nr:hypothetical protein [Anaeromyxobacter sp.]
MPPRGRPANVAPRDAPRLAGTSTRPTCEVTALGDGCHGVRLSGRFLPGWAGRLAASLAARGISVLHGHAERLSAHGWEVELELRSSNAAMDLGRLDLVALTREERGGAAPTGDVPLSRVRIARGESEI